jgi:hypothetical protein
MKVPSLQTVSGRPEGPLWHAAIGRVVVTFGTLERLLLAWADSFAPDMKLMQKHRCEIEEFNDQPSHRAGARRSARNTEKCLPLIGMGWWPGAESNH